MLRKALVAFQIFIFLPYLLVGWFEHASAAVTLVQSPNNVNNSGTSVSVTITAAVANNLLVVICGAFDSVTFATPSGFSSAINQAGTPSQGIFYKVAAGGETSVSCSFTGTATRMGIHVYEYSGIVTSSPLHGTPASNTGNSTTPTTNSITTTNANVLLVAGITVNANSNYGSWTNTFTERNDFVNGGAAGSRSAYGGADRIVSATGTYSTGATVSTGNWRGQLVAFTAINPVLSVDIVDSGGASVASPSASMSTTSFSFNCQTPTGTLGVSAQKIRVSNYTATATWTLSIAATSGATSNWTNGTDTYDFNDGSGAPAGCGDGADADSIAGRLTVNPSGSTLTAGSGCTTTGLTRGSSTSFAQGTTDSITLLTAGSTANTNCFWDVTSIALSQTIPPEQVNGNYSINLTLTVVAS